jgi:predicted HAD superfamily Cof-like phosphohydrolase
LAYAIQQAVIDFHTKFGHPVRHTPQTITEGEAVQAFGFIEEELNELWDDGLLHGDYGTREYSPNVVEIADALGDIVVTAYGMAIRHGIDLDVVLREIMESNMTKTANGLGKIQKGPEYRAPDIARVLAA